MAALIAIHSLRLRRILRRRTISSVALTGAVALTTLATLTACGSDTSGPRAIPPVTVLQMDVSAVNMALTPPYDTVTLHATATTSAGAPVDGVIRYSHPDSNVTVDSLTGVVTAHYQTSKTIVIATFHGGDVTIADTVLIQVTPSVQPRPRTFALLPNEDDYEPLDSAKVAVDYDDPPVLYIVAVDSAGDSVCTIDGCPFLWAATTSDPNIATLDAYGDVLPNNIGTVTFTATALIYGVRYQSALPFVVGYKLSTAVTVLPRAVGKDSTQLYFHPSVDTMAVGGRVGFLNQNADSIDVVFDDSTAAGNVCGYSGNIAPFKDSASGIGCNSLRRFHQTGTYHYHSRLFGTSGTLVIVP